jgi:tRNA pseudouridine13 synthase
MSGHEALPDWQRAHGGPVLRAVARSVPEDFQVTEKLDFEPSGDGEHDFLWIEKKDANTVWVARGLARMAGVPIRDVGYAGLKDRAAVTRQWFSVRRPGRDGTDWAAFQEPGVHILATARNQRKLRRGAHSGNEFRIALRGVSTVDGELRRVLERCRDAGVPNYFGEQRFGRAGSNIDAARAFFAGKRLKREQRSMAISAARAWLFNHQLERRVKNGTWNALQTGELISLDGSGSVFPIDEQEPTLRQRCAELDLHPSGAMWGKGEPGSQGAVALLEKSVANDWPDLAAGLERHAEQGRRALRMAVRNLRWSIDDEVLWLEFLLTRGGFATAVLREIASY